MVGYDMHPARCGAPGQALRLEGTACAIAPVRTTPLSGFDAVARGQPLLRRTSGHVVLRIILEPLGGQSLRPFAAGRAKRRDDGFDLAVLKGGEDPSHPINRVRRDPARGNPEGHFDGVEALVDPARVMLLAGHDLSIDDDACQVINRRVLLAGRAQRGTGGCRHGGVRIRAAERLEPAAPARVPRRVVGLGCVVGCLDRIQMARHRRIHTDIRPDQACVDVDGLG